MEIDARLERLESKLLESEDLLETLNRTVFRQQEQIDQLQAQIRVLYRQMQGQGSDGGERLEAHEEVPPHY